MVAAPGLGRRRLHRRASDHAAPGRRWAHSRQGPLGGRPLEPERRARSGPRGSGDDWVRAGAGAGGPADRGGRGSPGLVTSLAHRDVPPQARTLIAASGSFAAMSFIFASPLIAAVILIEATAIGGARLRLLLVPGLLASGIGSLVSLGVGSLSGLSTKAYALGPIPLSALSHLEASQFGWTIALAIVVAV